MEERVFLRLTIWLLSTNAAGEGVKALLMLQGKKFPPGFCSKSFHVVIIGSTKKRVLSCKGNKCCEVVSLSQLPSSISSIILRCANQLIILIFIILVHLDKPFLSSIYDFVFPLNLTTNEDHPHASLVFFRADFFPLPV